MRLSLLMLLVACDPVFDPPDSPAHTDFEDGFAHARGKDTPFLCPDPLTGARRACPDFRPEPAGLSCDAAGCHGDFDYTPDEGGRHLHGSDGPSCYTCHNREWSERKAGGGGND